MNNLNKRNKINKLKLMKSSLLSLSVLMGGISLSGCNNRLDKYYIVVDNHRNYICTKHLINNEDYEFESITNKESVGSICGNRRSFDYSQKNHDFTQKFLCELQVIPLFNALDQEGISTDLLEKHSDVVDLANSSSLNEIVNNQCVRSIYYLNQDFIYSIPSKLQFFVNDEGVMIGYDVSPYSEFEYKNKYIYSIYDQDVIEYTGNDSMDTYSVDIYLSEDDINKGYITFNEAVRMLNKYNEDHYQKQYK